MRFGGVGGCVGLKRGLVWICMRCVYIHISVVYCELVENDGAVGGGV